MKLTLIKKGDYLVADCEESEAIIKKMPLDGVIVEYKPKRSYKFHKKLFALLNLVFKNQEHYESVDNILEVVKFRAGHFETILTHTGNTHFKTKSISFADMNNAEFEQFYSKSIDVALELTSLTRANLENEIIKFI